MDVITIPRSEYLNSEIIKHKDYVAYPQAESQLQEAVRDIEGVAGFYHDSVVVIDYTK